MFTCRCGMLSYLCSNLINWYLWCDADAQSQHAYVSEGDSPLTAGSPQNSAVIERRFADEPLYQFYTETVVEVSYSRCEACTTLDCHGCRSINASSDMPHAVCCFMFVATNGYMVSYLRVWWNIDWDSMKDFVSVWWVAGYTERSVLCNSL